MRYLGELLSGVEFGQKLSREELSELFAGSHLRPYAVSPALYDHHGLAGGWGFRVGRETDRPERVQAHVGLRHAGKRRDMRSYFPPPSFSSVFIFSFNPNKNVSQML